MYVRAAKGEAKAGVVERQEAIITVGSFVSLCLARKTPSCLDDSEAA